VPLLAQRFLQMAARRLGTTAKRLDAGAIERRRAHDRPGNVRELENACWRLAALAPDERIGAQGVYALTGPSERCSARATATDGVAWEAALADWARARLAADAQDLHGDARERMERILFDAALEFTGGHRGDAAARLGLGRNTLTRRLGRKQNRKGSEGN